jgi:CRISPR-associated protein Cas2
MYLVAYDIPDNRRRGRLAEALLAFGVRVQESVFECDLRAKNELARMLDHIRREIMPEDGDHVRIYRLCADCLAQTIILGEGQIATDPDLIII